MYTAYVIVTVVAAAFVGFSALSVFIKAKYVVEPLTAYGVPQSWWTWLGLAKTAGAVGLAVGLFIPFIGVAAGIGLVLYFIGALITVARARWYGHLAAPLMYLVPVAASLTLGFAA